MNTWPVSTASRSQLPKTATLYYIQIYRYPGFCKVGCESNDWHCKDSCTPTPSLPLPSPHNLGQANLTTKSSKLRTTFRSPNQKRTFDLCCLHSTLCSLPTPLSSSSTATAVPGWPGGRRSSRATPATLQPDWKKNWAQPRKTTMAAAAVGRFSFPEPATRLAEHTVGKVEDCGGRLISFRDLKEVLGCWSWGVVRKAGITMSLYPLWIHPCSGLKPNC